MRIITRADCVGPFAQWPAHMERAFELARSVLSCAPNPRVGCVIVRDGRRAGEGFHAGAGREHAEIMALAADPEGGAGATVLVTLEPCSHEGRTGACVEALIDAGARQVVIAGLDPNPRVSGIGRLEAAGIEVFRLEEFAAAATALNRGFVKRMRRGRPFARCKLAMSLDGRTALANGRSKWITGPQARADAQLLRAGSCAVVTGINTVLADDPALNVRPETLAGDARKLAENRLAAVAGMRAADNANMAASAGRPPSNMGHPSGTNMGHPSGTNMGHPPRLANMGHPSRPDKHGTPILEPGMGQPPGAREASTNTGHPSRDANMGSASTGHPSRAVGSGQPLRVVLDSRLRIPPQAKTLSLEGAVKIFSLRDAAQDSGLPENAEVIAAPALRSRVDPEFVLDCLAARFECNEILVEAGPALSGALVRAGLVDELVIYMAPCLLGSDAQPLLELTGLQSLDSTRPWVVKDVVKVGDDLKIIARPTEEL